MITPLAGFQLQLLARSHRRKSFASGDSRVDDWLRHRALSAADKHTSSTRVLADDDGHIGGFYTLANTALDVSLVPPELFGGKRPSRPPPTLTLAWLGVCRHHSGRGVGTWLFARALADGVQIHRLVRFVAVVVDALSAANFEFYHRKGFVAVPGTTHKLYLPASTLLEITRS